MKPADRKARGRPWTTDGEQVGREESRGSTDWDAPGAQETMPWGSSEVSRSTLRQAQGARSEAEGRQAVGGRR